MGLLNGLTHLELPELRADLFSHHASAFRSSCFCGGGRKREVEMLPPTEICHRCNGKEQRRRGGRNVQLPDWVTNRIKREHIVLA